MSDVRRQGRPAARRRAGRPAGRGRRHRRDRHRAVAGPAPRSSTPTGWSPCPGLVDLHTHLREPGREDAETVETGTAAAALGGFTAVHAMANTDPVADTAGVVEQVWRLGREAGHCDVHPVGAVTVGPGRASGWPSSARWPTRAARVRVFSDDGNCVSDAVLMRRALEYVKAFDGVVAQHAQEPRLTEGAQMNEGELSGRARPAGLAGRRRGGDHRPRRAARRARRLPAARLPRVDRRVGRDPALGQVARAGTSPPRSPRTTCCSPTSWPTTLRPGVQGQPAAAHRRRRGRAARGARRRHDRRRRHRPRAAPARGQGLRVGARRRWGCSASRPRCRSCRRRWSRPGCSTGPASPTGCRPARPGSAGSTATAGRSRSARRPTWCWSTRPRAGRSTRSRWPPRSRNTPYAGRELPGAVVATFLRGRPTVLDGKLQ